MVNPRCSQNRSHPAPFLKSGYAQQREVELATFLHPRARMTLSRLEVKPTGFGVLSPMRG